MEFLKSTNYLQSHRRVKFKHYSCFQPKELKLHSIAAGHKCRTKGLSNFVDIPLKQLLSKIKSGVKDDFEFLKKCKRNLKKHSKLVSFDVIRIESN